jgi:hypothetical protein
VVTKVKELSDDQKLLFYAERRRRGIGLELEKQSLDYNLLNLDRSWSHEFLVLEAIFVNFISVGPKIAKLGAEDVKFDAGQDIINLKNSSLYSNLNGVYENLEIERTVVQYNTRKSYYVTYRDQEIWNDAGLCGKQKECLRSSATMFNGPTICGSRKAGEGGFAKLKPRCQNLVWVSM